MTMNSPHDYSGLGLCSEISSGGFAEMWVGEDEDGEDIGDGVGNDDANDSCSRLVIANLKNS